MKKINNILIKGFHFINLILIILYLYPGSILGYFLYGSLSIQPQITRDFSISEILISSNHFYVFVFLSIVGISAYKNTKKINLLINYLFLLSATLEIFHTFIPNRQFEFSDLFGNVIGVVVVIIFYKIIKKYE